MQLESLAGKTALVSGGGSGIGLAIAEALVKEGVNVAIGSRRLELLQTETDRMNQLGLGKALAVTLDVRTKDSVTAAIAEVTRELGEIDILVNNAGLGVQDLVVDCSEKDWDLVLETNAKGTFFLSQAVLPAMQKKQDGFILNIASQAAKHGYERTGPYCAAKFAVYGFGLALQEEVKQYGIRVHSLCPGLVQVPTPELVSEQTPGWLQTQDLANTALFVLKQPKRVNLENIGLMGF